MSRAGAVNVAVGILTACVLAVGTAGCGNDALDVPGGDAGSPGGVDLPDYTGTGCWGSAATTTVYSGETHELGPVNATCRGETERTAIYVADELWENPIDQAQVNGWLHRFELFTPEGSVDPGRGVLANDEAVFGELDRSSLPGGKLEVYVVDTSGAGEGYLCSWCDYAQLHLDGRMLVPLDSDKSLAIAAHETVHAIHRSRDPDEVMWVDETLAQAAMTANGYLTDLQWLESFRRNPNVDWGPGMVEGVGSFHYGAGLVLGSFLWERGGADLLRAIVAEPENGWDGLDRALAATGESATAWQLYREFMVAAFLDRPELGYGIASLDQGGLVASGSLGPGQSASGTLEACGLVYYTLDAVGELQLSAGTDEDTTDLLAVAVSASATGVEIVDIVGGGTLSVGADATAFVALTARWAMPYAVAVR